MIPSNSPMLQENVERYLNLLGVGRKKQSLESLSELIEAHLWNVPFENISKLHYRAYRDVRVLSGLELFLEGIESFHFGGTCYTNNYYFCQLLENLGYKIRLCGADMSDPDVHIVSMVALGEHEYLVDVGYAAPFLMPMPVDLDTDYTLHLGQDRYVLKPKDDAGCSKMELYRDGKLNHGYVVNPTPRQIQEFEHIIVDSFRDEETFMNALLLAKFSPKRSYIVHNMTSIEYQDNKSNVRNLKGTDELVDVVHEWFGIPKEFGSSTFQMELNMFPIGAPIR
jgi:N-hydroxyarylamine O-acetyltransferase